MCNKSYKTLDEYKAGKIADCLFPANQTSFARWDSPIWVTVFNIALNALREGFSFNGGPFSKPKNKFEEARWLVGYANRYGWFLDQKWWNHRV